MVSGKFGQLKLEDKLSKIWGKRNKLSFTPVITDIKHAHGRTVSEYTISVTAPLTHKQVLSLSKEEVLKLIESVKKPVKVQIRLECIMEKTDPITGEVTTDSYYPSSFTSNIFPTTNVSEKYDGLSVGKDFKRHLRISEERLGMDFEEGCKDDCEDHEVSDCEGSRVFRTS